MCAGCALSVGMVKSVLDYKPCMVRRFEMLAKITAKGQITIPKRIREMLGVKPGDRLLFSREKGRVVIYPVKGTLFDLRGSLKPKKRPEDLEEVREKVRREVARRAADEGVR